MQDEFGIEAQHGQESYPQKWTSPKCHTIFQMLSEVCGRQFAGPFVGPKNSPYLLFQLLELHREIERATQYGRNIIGFQEWLDVVGLMREELRQVMHTRKGERFKCRSSSVSTIVCARVI